MNIVSFQSLFDLALNIAGTNFMAYYQACL
jgi:hypothetical protein